ncbi:MAG: PQ-loop domain-containing transporter [bacterium]|nr:PQ-loop domain-containing transporter [bacterium]
MEALKNVVSVLVAIAGFANALLFVPQAWRIWRGKSADGVSLTTFGGFLLFQATFFIHGFLHQDWALASGMGASFLTCGAVVALAVRYRR